MTPRGYIYFYLILRPFLFIVLDTGATLVNTIALLKDNPYLGPKMSDRFNVDTPLRYFVISKQLVFYNIKNDNIEIIRILDSRQDYLSLLL